jgi:stringent starvation protein B
MSMSSSRPYLLRAFYDWIVDNQCMPYIVVNAMDPRVDVPLDYVQEGQIVLNIGPASVKNLLINDEYVSFTARFRGISHDIAVPPGAVIAIYAKENGQGMVFDPEFPTGDDPVDPSDGARVPGKGKPSLKIVK